MRTSLVESLWEVFHHSQVTVLVDQFLILVVILFVGGVQLMGAPASTQLLLMLLPFGATYLFVLMMRLSYLGWI
jgi:hypothetical protein